MDDSTGTMIVLAILVFYFLPAIVAGILHHPKAAAIFVLNSLFGWTLVGWGIAMVWAFAGPDPKESKRW